jgi:hypothetical protein
MVFASPTAENGSPFGGEEDEDAIDYEALKVTPQEFREQQAEMMTIEADSKRFWKVMSLWYVGGSSYFFYLVLLGFLQVDEFRRILERDGWFFFMGVGSLGFVLLFIVITLYWVFFGDEDVLIWNTSYKRSQSKRAKIKFKKGNATYAVMKANGMKGQTSFGKKESTTSTTTPRTRRVLRTQETQQNG